MSEYPKHITFPEFLLSVGDVFGTLRNITNLELMRRAPQYARGSKTDEVSRLGMRAELIALYHFWNEGIEHRRTDLLAPTPRGEPDIILKNGARIDVKGVRPNDSEFRVNDGAHVKDKGGITHYMFVQERSDSTALYWAFTHKQVSEWDLKWAGFTNAYCHPIEKFPKLVEVNHENSPARY